jgi:hypothetical protein
MTIEKFENDDEGYRAWRRAHPRGYVVNANRNPKPSYLKLHRTWCTHISVLRRGMTTWTAGDYIKVCSDSRRELARWAESEVGGALDGACDCP